MSSSSSPRESGSFPAQDGRTSPDAAFPWLPFYDPGVSPSLVPTDIPLYGWLDKAAAETPRRPACLFYNTRLTYAALHRLAEVAAANLRRNGLKPGDRVGVMLPNMPQTLIVFWGILKAGGVVTMINPLYREKELLHQIRDAGATQLVSIDLCWPRLNALRDRLGVEHFYITTAAEGLSFPLNWLQRIKAWWGKTAASVSFDQVSVHPFSVLLKGRERLSHPPEDPKTALALLQYTGGTTGLSKGAMLSHANLNANVEQLSACLGFLKNDEITHTLVGVLPFFHVYGLMTCLLLPVHLRAVSVPVPRYVPAELLGIIGKYKGTILPGAPAIFISLLQQKNAPRQRILSSLFCCISGSAPMPEGVIRHYEEELGVKIIEGYGLSEASPVTHLTPLRGLRKVGSIGIPLPGTEARIVDMELGVVPLPPGKVGELVLRGPQVMSGYWNNPDETAGTLRNGWLYTGDIAVMDEDGYFRIVDRKKDMIVVGGYNVAPREIDEVLFDHPKVQEAVAVGVPHPSRGEIIKAYVVLKPGETATRAEIGAWCRQRLASYKVPRQVEFRQELPKTLMGKTLRRALRAEETARQEAAAARGTTAESGSPGEKP
ncbi:MAG: long-chain fatty acid--CoA ligase [Desulfovibrio sp.]|nr:long-chain fatty acid--CoA ligase [Desulfovibrio sp.]